MSSDAIGWLNNNTNRCYCHCTTFIIMICATFGVYLFGAGNEDPTIDPNVSVIMAFIIPLIWIILTITFEMLFKRRFGKENLDLVSLLDKEKIIINTERFSHFYLLAKDFLIRNDIENAIKMLSNALRYIPIIPQVWNVIGDFFLKKGLFISAGFYFDNALKIDPNFKEVEDKIEIIEKVEEKFSELKNFPLHHKLLLSKCLKCGTRENLKLQQFSKKFYETITNPPYKRKVSGINRTIYPICEECIESKPNMSKYIDFTFGMH